MLGAVLLLIAGGGTLVVSSCGSGGGDSTGALCEQCGQTDGPCQPSVTVTGSDAAELCPSGQTTCDVQLDCFRKLGSAQQRCFPITGVQFEQFRCDGERAHRPTVSPSATPTLSATPTPTPSSSSSASPGASGSAGLTATPQATSTPALTATPVPTPAAVCGNGIVEGSEQCDGADLNDEDCFSLCDDGEGTLMCNANCTFNFSLCDFPGTCSPP